MRGTEPLDRKNLTSETAVLPMSFSSLRFRTFCHATEDERKVRQALDFVTGGAEIQSQYTKGLHGNRLVVMEAAVKGRAKIDEFWSRVGMSGIVPEILEKLEPRISESLELCLRFDKQGAYLGHFALDSGGDVIHLRAKGDVRPAQMDGAVAAIRRYFQKREQC